MCAIASEPSEASAVRRREGPLPEKPLFTVELVIFTIRADRLHVLLVERADQPRKMCIRDSPITKPRPSVPATRRTIPVQRGWHAQTGKSR